MADRRLRALILAEQCNPEWPSLPIVGFKYAVAISRFVDVTVVTQVRNESAVRKVIPRDTDALGFHFIDTEYIAGPMHRAAARLRGGDEVAWSTNMAMNYLPYLEFERQAWKRFGGDLRDGRYDVLHRITPMSPTLPSWIAGRADVPFVIGPLNGNLDWPAAFAAEQRREREGLRRLRNVYKVLPYTRRTWRHADRVLAAFQHTIDDLDQVATDRIVMFPEVGYDESIFYPPPGLLEPDEGRDASKPADGPPSEADSLTFLFAGRLVPYKLAEVVVRAFLSSPDLRDRHRLRVVGDGPERGRLEQMVIEAGTPTSITLEGRMDQRGVASAMRESDVFVFPSIRELGAGVVVEAMACGMYSLVVDYGGPADLVASDRGTKVAMAPLDDLVVAFRDEMEALAAAGRDALAGPRRAAVRHAADNFRWDSKAEITEGIYREVLAEPSSTA